ncbi:hypothetical protein [Sphingomonas sp. LT1P40]|uniref:hypothetical protein n=1 Tax=Alteristakelama amylovorans TaxID=3096166 RepID=UPI002FC91A0B
MSLDMRWLSRLLALAFLSGTAAGSSLVRDAGDLVVFGKLDQQEYSESLDELGLNGLITARLRITRVVSGRPPSELLRIQYIAHTYRSQGRAFLFHLRRSDDGTYLVCGEGGRGFICD